MKSAAKWQVIPVRLLARLVAVAISTSCVLPAWGQSAVWLPQGAISGNIYYNGGNVGIGTTLPTGPLDILTNTNSVARNLFVRNTNSGTSAFSIVELGNDVNNIAGEVAIASSANTQYGTGGDLILLANSGSMTLRTTSARPITFFTGGASAMTIVPGGNVGIGTTNPQHLLQVAGTIGAEEVLVSSTGADYVFRPDYHLQPLSEVAAYIEANHHLPGIPSEAEVKGKGMAVGEMEATLLAKIEELTLHVIKEHDRSDALERQNRELQQRITRLEARTIAAGER